MTLSVGHLSPIVSLLAGILILLMPRLLNYIVAIYLIVIGIIGPRHHQVAGRRASAALRNNTADFRV